MWTPKQYRIPHIGAQTGPPIYGNFCVILLAKREAKGQDAEKDQSQPRKRNHAESPWPLKATTLMPIDTETEMIKSQKVRVLLHDVP